MGSTTAMLLTNRMLRWFLFLGLVAWGHAADQEEEAKRYLERIEKVNLQKTYETTIAEWAYETNITDGTLTRKLATNADYAKFAKAQWLETTKFHWQTFKDADLARKFKKISKLGSLALPEDKYEKLEKLIADMQSIYSKAKICAYNNTEKCDLNLEPEITNILRSSRNEAELRHVWIEFRKKIGSTVRPLYKEYVSLLNEAAKLNNYTDASEDWVTQGYDSPDFKEQLAALWQQLRPFYLEMHAYMRRKLREKYGENIVSKRGLIPAHLLGNMWGQSWSNIADLGLPYPDAQIGDVTKYLIEQNYTPLKIFKRSEEFFTSIDLSPMPEQFWKESVLEKPKDRDIVCHASAWDFYNGVDFRIKQCTDVTHSDFTTAHHEMGHVEYYIQYKDQPFMYREGANPGFHEAIGDLIALSVNTAKHLNKIGLLPNATYGKEADLNHLFKVALSKIAFLPFGYLVDLWRWNVFKNVVAEDNYNCEWWKLRAAYQGLKPPTERSEADFDPAAKYHVVSNTPYIRYFVAFVLQFQFHEALCEVAGEYNRENPSEKPLHQCDIYQSKEAGRLLKKVLQMGSSKPWPDALEMITGQRNMDAQPLLNYFAPIYEWLQEENKKSGEYVGWETNEKVCNSSKFSIGNFIQNVMHSVKEMFGAIKQ